MGRCFLCGADVPAESQWSIVGHGQVWVCDLCLDTEITRCERCGDLVLDEEAISCDMRPVCLAGERTCLVCHDRHMAELDGAMSERDRRSIRRRLAKEAL